MKAQKIKEVIKHWGYIAPIAVYPKTQKEFNKLVDHLDELLDIVGNDEAHPLIGLVDLLSMLVSKYETEHYQEQMGSGLDALKFLMNEHSLRQSDLSGIASQGVMSEILMGKRKLTLRHIKLLSEKFNVSSSTFIDD